MKKLNILTVCRHTAYLYLLSKTGHELYVLGKWDHSNRPVPKNVHLIGWSDIAQLLPKIDVIIGHHVVQDIMRLLPKSILARKPYIQVIHGNIARTGYSRSRMRKLIKQVYSISILKTCEICHFVNYVFISEYDKKGWPMEGIVINHGIPIDEMFSYKGHKAALITVGNGLTRPHFDLETLIKLREVIPVKVIGKTEGLKFSKPAPNWDELRALYSNYRAYLNITREPEKGYNLATLEAMATGMPVISLHHPFTPIKDGYNGFLYGLLMS